MTQYAKASATPNDKEWIASAAGSLKYKMEKKDSIHSAENLINILRIALRRCCLFGACLLGNLVKNNLFMERFTFYGTIKRSKGIGLTTLCQSVGAAPKKYLPLRILICSGVYLKNPAFSTIWIILG